MRQIIDTLAQLQRLRDKSVKDKTVELAKQKQICAGYDNNIKALGYLVEKTSAGAAASGGSLEKVSGHKGTLRAGIAWEGGFFKQREPPTKGERGAVGGWPGSTKTPD